MLVLLLQPPAETSAAVGPRHGRLRRGVDLALSLAGDARWGARRGALKR